MRKRITVIAAAVGAAAVTVIGGGAVYAATLTPPPARIGCVASPHRLLNEVYENVPANFKCPSGFAVGLSGAGTPGAPGLAHLQADEPYGADVDPNANVTQSDGTVPAGQTAVVWAACPAGKTAIGGGFRIGNGTSADAAESDSTGPAYSGSDVQVLASESSYETGGKLSLAAAPQVTSYGSYLPNAWAVTVHNSGTSPANARANVICATVSS